LAAGALGICCATPHEAVAFARAGIRDLLVTAPVVQPSHMRALADLHGEGIELTIVIDHPDGVDAWEALLGACGHPLSALVDIDIGMGRTGAGTIDQVIAIARRLAASKALEYTGVQAYSGRVQHINDYGERRRTYWCQLDRLERAIMALKNKGLPPAVVSGG